MESALVELPQVFPKNVSELLFQWFLPGNKYLVSLSQFIEDISDRLDGIHAENKAMFFECLTPATLEELEPSYE